MFTLNETLPPVEAPPIHEAQRAIFAA